MKKSKGTVDIELNGESYTVQYAISNVKNGTFDLKITVDGKSIKENVTQFSRNPINDVIVPHGERMLGELVEQFQSGG